MENEVDYTAQIEELKSKLAEKESENTKLKTSLSEKNSENATKKREIEDWKQKYESTLSEGEKAEQARAEKEAEKDALLQSLLREKDVNGHKANFLAVGYDAEMAQRSAEALVDGNFKDVFDDLSAFMTETKKQITAESLKHQPNLTDGEPPKKEDMEKAEVDKLRKYAGL